MHDIPGCMRAHPPLRRETQTARVTATEKETRSYIRAVLELLKVVRGTEACRRRVSSLSSARSRYSTCP